jgi:hypothetical protein
MPVPAAMPGLAAAEQHDPLIGTRALAPSAACACTVNAAACVAPPSAAALAAARQPAEAASAHALAPAAAHAWASPGAACGSRPPVVLLAAARRPGEAAGAQRGVLGGTTADPHADCSLRWQPPAAWSDSAASGCTPSPPVCIILACSAAEGLTASAVAGLRPGPARILLTAWRAGPGASRLLPPGCLQRVQFKVSEVTRPIAMSQYCVLNKEPHVGFCKNWHTAYAAWKQSTSLIGTARSGTQQVCTHLSTYLSQRVLAMLIYIQRSCCARSGLPIPGAKAALT